MNIVPRFSEAPLLTVEGGGGDTKKEGGGGFWKKGALLVKGYGHPSTLVAVGFRCQDKFCSTCVKEGKEKVFLRGTAENFTFSFFFCGKPTSDFSEN